MNDFDDPKPVSSATIVALDCDTHGLEAKRPVQAVSEARPLVVIASDPSQLQGCLAHFPMLRIGAPGRDFVLAVMADVRSAACATLPKESQLGVARARVQAGVQ